MSRASLFMLVVLIGAAAVAGVVALSRTSAATGGTSSTAPAASQQISYRLKQLDRLEASLRQKLADASKPVPSPSPSSTPGSTLTTPAPAADQPPTVYVRRPGVTVIAARHGDDDGERGWEHESGGGDD